MKRTKTDRLIAFLKPRYRQRISVYQVIAITGPLSYRQELTRARRKGNMQIESEMIKGKSYVRYMGKAA